MKQTAVIRLLNQTEIMVHSSSQHMVVIKTESMCGKRGSAYEERGGVLVRKEGGKGGGACEERGECL